MPLSRRRLMTATVAAAAVLGGAGRAAAAAETVDVTAYGARGDGRRDDSNAFQAALRSGASIVRVPAGRVFLLRKPVMIKDCTLQVDGAIDSDSGLFLSGVARVTGTGDLSFSKSYGGLCIHEAGAFVVEGVRFVDCSTVAALLVAPRDGVAVDSVDVRDCRFDRVNYAILRQYIGYKGSVGRCLVTRNRMQDLQGDGVEFNCPILDGPIEITDNVIVNVNNTQKKPHWGIGIGLAGLKYTDPHDTAFSIKKVIVRNNVLRGMRQGIHVESGFDILIEGNTVDQISAEYSKDASLEVYGIILYGCAAVQIQNNAVTRVDGLASIANTYGALNGVFVGAPKDIHIEGNRLDGTGRIVSNARSETGFVSILGNDAGRIVHFGLVRELTVSRNRLSGLAAPGIEIVPEPLTGPAVTTGRRFASRIAACGNLSKGLPYEVTVPGVKIDTRCS